MGKLFAVIKREYLERVRSPWFLIVTLFGPLFFATIMVLPGYLSLRGMRESGVSQFTVLDASGSGLGERLADRISARPNTDSLPPALAETVKAMATVPRPVVEVLTVDALAAREAALVAEVQEKRLVGFLVIDSATVDKGVARYAGRNAGSVGETERIESALRSALLSMRIEAAGISAATAESLTRLRISLSADRITDKGKGGSGLASAFLGGGVAMLLYFSIVFYGQAILRGVLEEKTTRVAEVIVSSVSPDTLLAGKVLGVGAVGLTQQLVWLSSGVFFWTQRGALFKMLGMGAPPPMAFPTVSPTVLVALVLFFLLGYTLYASLFAAVGAMVGSQEEANQASQPVIMLLVFSIIFLQPVLLNPTGRLAQVVSWVPFSAPIIMPMRMTATEIGVGELAAVLLGVLAMCVACVWVAARIYRIGLLMYGKRPGMGELMRWIRQA